MAGGSHSMALACSLEPMAGPSPYGETYSDNICDIPGAKASAAAVSLFHIISDSPSPSLNQGAAVIDDGLQPSPFASHRAKTASPSPGGRGCGFGWAV